MEAVSAGGKRNNRGADDVRSVAEGGYEGAVVAGRRSEPLYAFNVYMSALYGVNRAFKDEAIKLLREYLAVITFMLQESQARGELRTDQIEAMALMMLSLTESYVLTARVLGQSEQEITRQARHVARFILQGGAAMSR